MEWLAAARRCLRKKPFERIAIEETINQSLAARPTRCGVIGPAQICMASTQCATASNAFIGDSCTFPQLPVSWASGSW